MRATEVLQGIEKCIKAFWMYVKTDQTKPQWKISKFMWTYPPVEDPRDLELLADLTKTLRKVIPVMYLHSEHHIQISVAEIWRTMNLMHFRFIIIHRLNATNGFFFFPEEGAMAKRLAREEEVLVEKRSKPSGSIS